MCFGGSVELLSVRGGIKPWKQVKSLATSETKPLAIIALRRLGKLVCLLAPEAAAAAATGTYLRMF